MKDDFEERRAREFWGPSSNCYAYSLRRPDIGWINPGWIANTFGKAELPLREIFSAFSPAESRLGVALRKYQELLLKDGCTANDEGLDQIPPGRNAMYFALTPCNGLYDYHCYRYDGNGEWSEKNGTAPPRVIGKRTEQQMIDTIKARGGIPLGLFILPELPENVTPLQRKTLAHLQRASDAHCIRLRFGPGRGRRS